jgi:hypothetical protein
VVVDVVVVGAWVVVVGEKVVVGDDVVVVVVVVKIHIPPTQVQPTSGQHTWPWPDPLQYTVPGGHSQSPSTPSRQHAPLPLSVYPGGHDGGGGVGSAVVDVVVVGTWVVTVVVVVVGASVVVVVVVVVGASVVVVVVVVVGASVVVVVVVVVGASVVVVVVVVVQFTGEQLLSQHVPIKGVGLSKPVPFENGQYSNLGQPTIWGFIWSPVNGPKNFLHPQVLLEISNPIAIDPSGHSLGSVTLPELSGDQ